MKIVTTTMEGTPEELARYQAASNAASGAAASANLNTPSTASSTPEVVKSPAPPSRFVTEEVARRVLNRRPLSPEQRQVLVMLYRAHPAKVSSGTLQNETGYTARQLAGMMGAFGRRVSHTPGFETGMNLFDWVWADDGWHYGLPDTVRTAMEVERLV